MDKAKVDYSRVSIFQASDLKDRLETLEINRDGVTIASVYAVNMYPSIKIAKIRKYVRFFSRKITIATNKTINLFLYLIRFGLIPTLISFDREYYEYHGG